MKNLLKLLAILTITTPATLNVVACGSNDKTPDEQNENNPNFLDMLKSAETKIADKFGKFITAEKNLTFRGQFGEDMFGKTIQEYLNNLTANTKIDNQEIKDAFFNILKEGIAKIANSLLTDTSLQLLFSGIPINTLLKLDVGQSELWDVDFDWSKLDGRFGIKGYDPNDFNITFWKKIEAKLKLELSYKNEKGKNAEKEINQNCIMYFANTNAEISKIVTSATENIFNNLNNYIIDTDLQKRNLTIKYDKNKILELVTEQLKIKINNNLIMLNNYDAENWNDLQRTPPNGYDWAVGGAYNFNPYLKKDKKQFETDLTTSLETRNKVFDTDFADWKQQNIPSISIADKQKIFIYGTYTLSDWSINGLSLKNISLPMIVKRSRTRDEINTLTIKAITGLFAKDGLITADKQFQIGESSLYWFMNSTDFDKYINDKKSFYDTLDYISGKITNLAISNNLLDANDTIKASFEWQNDTKYDWILSTKNVDNKSIDTSANVRNSISLYGYQFCLLGKLSGAGVIKATENIWPT